MQKKDLMENYAVRSESLILKLSSKESAHSHKAVDCKACINFCHQCVGSFDFDFRIFANLVTKISSQKFILEIDV